MATRNRFDRPFAASPMVVPDYRFPESAEGRALAEAVVEASHRPSPILDMNLRATERSAAEREMLALLRQKDVLLREMQHRMANSLQIIASILLLKAGDVGSEEARQHLKDAHRRIMSVASVQQQLDALRHGGQIELAPYLSRLCDSLTVSMVDDDRPIAIKVRADRRKISSDEAASIGLIVTELVTNALKHAFVSDPAASRLILIAYEVEETGWRLTVSDNGTDKPNGSPPARPTPGLGTAIVEALARQLDARMETSTGANGAETSVSITHGTVQLAAAPLQNGRNDQKIRRPL